MQIHNIAINIFVIYFHKPTKCSDCFKTKLFIKFSFCFSRRKLLKTISFISCCIFLGIPFLFGSSSLVPKNPSQIPLIQSLAALRGATDSIKASTLLFNVSNAVLIENKPSDASSPSPPGTHRGNWQSRQR